MIGYIIVVYSYYNLISCMVWYGIRYGVGCRLVLVLVRLTGTGIQRVQCTVYLVLSVPA